MVVSSGKSEFIMFEKYEGFLNSYNLYYSKYACFYYFSVGYFLPAIN